MHFFLTEIAARIVAAYLCFDTGRDLLRGFAERKIAPFSPDFLDWFNPWTNIIADRDSAPVSYWAHTSVHVGIFLACLAVAIFGWFQSGAWSGA